MDVPKSEPAELVFQVSLIERRVVLGLDFKFYQATHFEERLKQFLVALGLLEAKLGGFHDGFARVDFNSSASG